MKDPWLIADDFNDIMRPDEKNGGVTASSRKCNLFRDREDACKLMDLGSSGPKFTWKDPIYNGGQRIYEKLDRAMINI
ncbi:unnamed protein product [Lathyrus sativus]|nr:unnamed protein product [Lathyrus sativus]